MITIGRISAALGSMRKKAPLPQPATLDKLGEFLTGRSAYGQAAAGPVRNAKASAAFFNAQIRKGVINPDAVVQNNTQLVKTLQTPSKTNKLVNFFKGLYNNGVKAVKNGYNKVANKLKGTKVSNPFKGTNAGKYVKTGVKVALAAAIIAGVVYAGKKAYDYFANKNNTYTVKENDNLWNIAKRDLESKSKDGKVTNAQVAVRAEELKKLNNLTADENGKVIIKPDSKIKLK